MTRSLAYRAAGEGIGAAFLVMAVVGSGIMADALSGGNAALALLCNTIATAGALLALILAIGPVSGAHFNPAVSVVEVLAGRMPWRDLPAYLGAQFTGAVAGVWVAHAMFALPLVQVATKVRAGPAQWLSEVVATSGLLLVIAGCAARDRAVGSITTPVAVAAYIGAAYWFTASTSFANPAVTVARALSDTFAGIRPADAGLFIVAQVIAVGIVVGANRLRRA
ncbi:MAG: MIP/aquaporin family protein [Rhodospirillaceae bacterium]|nr:MIP/aquaporin family protein [Rhodospirillaceae bacterium]